jgi:RNA recognition motif-containing protein
VNIYIGNLSFTTTEEDLRERVSQFGEVTSVNIITDRDSGRSRGFGFVDMPHEDEARAAIAGLNGTDLGGRALTVNEARPRTDRRGGGGRYGGDRY